MVGRRLTILVFCFFFVVSAFPLPTVRKMSSQPQKELYYTRGLRARNRTPVGCTSIESLRARNRTPVGFTSIGGLRARNRTPVSCTSNGGLRWPRVIISAIPAHFHFISTSVPSHFHFLSTTVPFPFNSLYKCVLLLTFSTSL